MDFDCIVKIINSQLIENNKSPLNASQNLVLRGIWNCQTYHQIAREAGYSPGYFTNVVAPELCQRLSQLVGQRVTKKNCRKLLLAYVAKQKLSRLNSIEPAFEKDSQQNDSPCYPSGSVPLDSPFYINRVPFELQISQEITKPGALVRIKGPREIGKTSILTRILEDVKHQGYHTITLNPEQIERAILSDLNRLLRCLCTSATYQLQLPLKLDDYWDEDLGSKISCTLYFQDYLLEQVEAPIVLAFDDLDLIFEYSEVARDFLALLRSWYEEAKRYPIWQKLRLIMVNSTEIYVPLDLNQSPFNVGLTIELNDFSSREVLELAKRYGFDWNCNSIEARQLMRMLEGHPALIQIAFYYLSNQQITLQKLLETAPTSLGIYHNHLQRHWVALQKNPQLLQVLNRMINAPESVKLDPIVAYQLNSIGLIKQSQGRTRLRCELYRQYFARAIDLGTDE